MLKKRTEYDVQFQLARYASLKYPKALFNSDLGGVKLTVATAKKMAAIRPLKGHPDFIVYERRGEYSGLFIELKKEDIKLKYKASLGYAVDEHQANQYAYMCALEQRGFCCTFAVGFEEAKSILDAYLNSDFETLKTLKKL